MNMSPQNLRGKSFLPEHYRPSAADVICARGTKSFYHCGNRSFRKAVADNLAMYGASTDKRDKSMIVSSIANKFYFNDDERCRFIRFCNSKKRWYEIPYDQVRQKVGQTMRDTLLQQDPQRLSRKKQSRARRASSRRCIAKRTNPRFSQSVGATTRTQPKEHAVHSSPRGRLFCETVPLSINVTSSTQQTRKNVSIPGQEQRCSELSLENLEWSTLAGKGALSSASRSYALIDCRPEESDSDTTSVSSYLWFQECDEVSLSNSDWLDGDHGKIWT